MNNIRVALDFTNSEEMGVFIVKPYEDLAKMDNRQFVDWIVEYFEEHMADRQFTLYLHDGWEHIEHSFYPVPNGNDKQLKAELRWSAQKIVEEYRN